MMLRIMYYGAVECPGPPIHNCTDRNHPVLVELWDTDKYPTHKVAYNTDLLGRQGKIEIQVVEP